MPIISTIILLNTIQHLIDEFSETVPDVKNQTTSSICEKSHRDAAVHLITKKTRNFQGITANQIARVWLHNLL